MPFAEVLEAAKQLYFAGEHREALERFRELQIRLLTGSEVPFELAAEAMTFLGELSYELGMVGAMRDAFRWVLERAPDHEMSPYHHPADVVLEFVAVQKEVQAEIAARQVEDNPAVRAPLPAWGYLPLGIPQFSQRRPAAGAAFLATQAALGAGSLALWIHLDNVNPGPNDLTHPRQWTEEENRQRVQRQRLLAQWPLTVGFYGAYGLSLLDARRAWRRQPLPIARDAQAAAVVRISGRL